VRRLVVSLGTLSLLLVGLTACGDDDGSGGSGSVTVSGEFGAAPTVKYDGEVDRSSTETTVLTEGDGAEVADDGSAMVHLYIGNGFTGEKALSTWDDKSPQVVTISKDTLPALRDAIAGQKVGSRVEVLATPEDAFGENGNPELFIGNDDSVVFVVDILSTVLDGPKGTEKTVAKGWPVPVEKDGKVTGLRFAKGVKPPKDLEVVTLVEGDGPAIEKKDYAVVRYLGQTYDGKKPFDETFSSDALQARQVGVGGYIKGWDQGLVGVKQGSRVLIVVPPRYGYGAKGSGKDIQGDDTLAFVIDVLGVA
jgi:peptidylprolyl isomerase